MSIQIFFIGDTHFGHKGILNYGRGQFQTIKEHDEYIVESWNSVVRPCDIVYHMGDVAWNLESLRYIKYCNGNKHLIQGNHDQLLIMDYVDVGFHYIRGCMKYKEFILTHVPIHPSCIEYNWKYNIHGHIHDKTKNVSHHAYINVSADMNGLRPISIDEIRDKIKSERLDFD